MNEKEPRDPHEYTKRLMQSQKNIQAMNHYNKSEEQEVVSEEKPIIEEIPENKENWMGALVKSIFETLSKEPNRPLKFGLFSPFMREKQSIMRKDGGEFNW